MANRELIYKDEARRAVLENAAGIAWCIDRIKPVAVVEDRAGKVAAKTDDYWIARIKYWPGDKEHIAIVKIFYAWENGGIQFIPFGCEEGDPIWATSCQLFELVERIEVDKYK